MTTSKFKVVEKLPNDTVIAGGTKDSGPFLRGGGSETYACGNCDYVLLKDISPELFFRYVAPTRLLLKCRGCDAFNHMPVANM